jgi:DNA-binding response OmpR family regulator
MGARVLIVDGSADDRRRASQLLAEAGYETDGAPDGIEGFELIQVQPCDLVIIDAKLDRLDSPALITKLRGHGIKAPILIWTSMANKTNLMACLRLGIADFVDKAAPLGDLVKKIQARLPNVASTAIPKGAEDVPQSAAKSSGGVLIIDDQEADHHAVRVLLPKGMRADACREVNAGFTHAHNHPYDMVLFNADSALTNLTGTIAQLHTLLPNACVVGTATLARNQDPVPLLKDLDDMGFDDALLKPYAAESMNLAVERYCSPWEDLVRMSDDVLTVSRRRCRKGQHEQYAGLLKDHLKAAVTTMVDACYERAIVDLCLVDSVLAVDVADVLLWLVSTAEAMGLTVRYVGCGAMIAALRRLQESFAWQPLPIFDSIAAARS